MAETARGVASSPFRTILVGVDSTERARGVLAAAIDLARRFDAELIVLRAVGMPTEIPPEVLREPFLELPQLLEARAREGIAALTSGAPPDVRIRPSVHIGVPWEAICHVAKDERVDLVVVGTHGHHGIDRLLGSTAARVVNHCDRPVLVVPDAPTAS